MSNFSNDLTTDVSNQYTELNHENKKVLTNLLNTYLEGTEKILVQKTEMGGTPAYIGSVTLEWFARRVNFASYLPLFQQKYSSQTENVEIDAESIDEIQQRPLDWSRQAPTINSRLC
jgi:hypothetical protein